jgi:V/A-type H+/Na+-transporting ATPase subunit D
MEMKEQITISRDFLKRKSDELKNATTGARILDQKVRGLFAAIIPRAHESATLESEDNRLYQEAYAALHRARLKMGENAVDIAGLSAPKDTEVKVTMHSVMGVPVPEIKFEDPPDHTSPPYSPGNTSVALDEAYRTWQEILRRLPNQGKKAGVIRMAVEVTKTKHRLNALNNIMIPKLTGTVKKVKDALDQQSLEELSRLFWTKRHLDRDKRK